MTSRVKPHLLLLVPALLAGAGLAQAQGARSNGPAADFPVVVGAPYAVGSTIYTPSDTMNYDAVGYAAVGNDGDMSVAAAHHTLPLPSYVEVTALDTGRTVLVRVVQRGPMHGNALIALSAGAAAQLGVGNNAPVRVRRVNPPEGDRMLLRAGSPAPARMDTPTSLLSVLMRKLRPGAPVALSTPARAPASMADSAAEAPAAAPTPAYVPPPRGVAHRPVVHAPARPLAAARPMAVADVPPAAPRAPGVARRVVTVERTEHTAPPPRAAAGEGGVYVQAGSFADRANAEALARRLGASVSRSGHVWHVHKGPYANWSAAAAALAKVRAAGYSGARILHGD